jgi:hypothetical protein
VLQRAYSKRRWRTIRKKANKKEEERLSGLRVLCRACLFIYFCSGSRARYTRWMVSLSFFIHTNRQILGNSSSHRKKEEENEGREREMQEKEYGRNCRQSSSSSSTDYNIGVRYKTEEQRARERRGKKNKKSIEY